MIGGIKAFFLSFLAFMATTGSASPLHHLSIAGATGSLAYLRRAVGGWEQLHPGYTVSISGGGSIAGLVEVSQGRINIGISDVAPQREWIRGGALLSKPLGRTPLLIIAHSKIGVGQVSASRMRAIFMGEIASWKTVGGKSTPIIVVSRPLASGALEALRKGILDGHRVTARAIVQLSNGAVLAAVQETPGAVGFIESSDPPKTVQVLQVGRARYSQKRPQNWPYWVTPSLYWCKPEGGMTQSLANYLATRPYRSEYGLFSLAS